MELSGAVHTPNGSTDSILGEIAGTPHRAPVKAPIIAISAEVTIPKTLQAA